MCRSLFFLTLFGSLVGMSGSANVATAAHGKFEVAVGSDVVSSSAQISSTVGLLLHYKFDESTGYTVYDSSGRGVDAQLDGPEGNWDPCNGYYDGCLEFNDNMAVLVPTLALDGISEQITVSVWLKGAGSSEADAEVEYVAFDLSGPYGPKEPCHPDFQQLADFCAWWLGRCHSDDWCAGYDADHDFKVNFWDFAALAPQLEQCP